MSVKIERQLVRDLIEMVRPEGADEVLRERYPGRGMFGAETWGLVFPSMTDVFQFFVLIGLATAEADMPWNDDDLLDAGDARELALAARTDSMGHDVIVYFPGTELTGE
jgi:hypothetical protein